MLRIPLKSLWQPRSRFFCKKVPTLFEEVLQFTAPFLFSDFYDDPQGSSPLKALKTAAAVDISATGSAMMDEEGGIRAVTLGNGVEIPQADSVVPNTLYIRDFYPRLFNSLRKEKRSILLGNPGISKFWFQWYMLYCLVNEEVSLGPDHPGKNSRPKVIIRQIGIEQLTLYFAQYDKAYSTEQVRNLIHHFKPDTALHLFEPRASLIEPYTTNVQMTLTCSPDQRRYKEFAKSGAIKYYMPCWNLAELQVVGAHLDIVYIFSILITICYLVILHFEANNVSGKYCSCHFQFISTVLIMPQVFCIAVS